MATTVPGRLTAPGPGSDAMLSIVEFPDDGRQKVPASVVGLLVPSGRSEPAGVPVSRKRRQLEPFWKHPALDWLGQNMPVALDISAVPVVTGDSVAGIAPTAVAQVPPGHWAAAVHAAPLFVPR
jgi:hypothetical protein